MNDPSPKSTPTTCADSPNATSSPASGCGPTLFDWLDGPTTSPSGPEAAPASPSAPPVSGSASKTRATFGRHGFGSSASAGLTVSLVSNLMKRTRGSILWRLTWKVTATPSGRLTYRLRASGAHTSASASTGWPTPTTPSGGQSVPHGTTVTGRRPDGSKATVTLDMAAQAAGWPTPMAGSPGTADYNPAGNTDSSRKTVALISGWATPAATDRPPNPATMEKCAAFRKRNANQNSVPLYLGDQAALSGWSTPQVADAEWARVASATYTNLTAQALQTGSSAETASGVRLNPEHSRWLMRLPPVWDACAVTAMPSTRKRRQTS